MQSFVSRALIEDLYNKRQALKEEMLNELYTSSRPSIYRLYAGAGIVLIVLAVAYGLLIAIPLLLLHSPEWLTSVTAYIACCGVVIIFGLGFYYLREKHRFIYASAELGAALATAFGALTALGESHRSFTFILTITGAIYIFVRACDNYKKWQETAPIRRSKLQVYRDQIIETGRKIHEVIEANQGEPSIAYRLRSQLLKLHNKNNKFSYSDWRIHETTSREISDVIENERQEIDKILSQMTDYRLAEIKANKPDTPPEAN